MKLTITHLEPLMPFNGQMNHSKAVLFRGGGGLRLARGAAGRNKNHPLSIQVLLRGLRRPNMAQMNRIKGAAEKNYPVLHSSETHKYLWKLSMIVSYTKNYFSKIVNFFDEQNSIFPSTCQQSFGTDKQVRRKTSIFSTPSNTAFKPHFQAILRKGKPPENLPKEPLFLTSRERNKRIQKSFFEHSSQSRNEKNEGRLNFLSIILYNSRINKELFGKAKKSRVQNKLERR
jgi:hypothetical protein